MGNNNEHSAETGSELMKLVFSFVLPADFMHVIETCREIYSRYEHMILIERKRSLVRFQDEWNVGHDIPVDDEDEDDTGIYNALSCTRGRKLPNGNLDGLCETISLWDQTPLSNQSRYTRVIFDNGNAAAEHIYCVRDDDLESVAARFKRWRDIDISALRLIDY